MKIDQMTLSRMKCTQIDTFIKFSAVHLKCTLFKPNTWTKFELIIHNTQKEFWHILQLVSMNYSEKCPFIIAGLLQATLCHFQFIKEISQVCTNL